MSNVTSETTTVLLGEVPLVAGTPFEWRLTAGVEPYITSVTVPNSAHAHLLEMRSPSSLTLRTAGCDEQRFVDDGAQAGKPREVSIHNVVLLGFDRVSAFEVRWQLADVRALWRRRGARHVARRFNWPTERNDEEASPENAPSLAETAGALATPEPGLPAARYVESTLDPESQRPWTALALAEYLLAQLAADNELAGRAHGLQDNGVIPERLSPEAAKAGADGLLRLVDDLLAEAEATLLMGADGRAVLLPADETPQSYLPAEAQLSEGSGGVAFSDAASLRPSEVHVHFEREEQRTFCFEAGNADETAANEPSETGPLALLNVLRLPEEEAAELHAPAGAWVPLQEALHAWGLTDAVVREHWFAGRLEAWLLEHSQESEAEGATAGTALKRAAAIRAHYRQSFALPRALLARLHSLRAVELERVDPDSGLAMRSVAVAPACLIPAQRPADTLLAEAPGNAERAAAAESQALHAGVNVPPAPLGEVHLLDGAAGVVRVELDAALVAAGRASLGAGLAVVPGHVEGAPPPYLQATGGWHRARLAAEFSLAFALTLRWTSPESRRRHTVTVPAEQAGASGFRTPAGPPAEVAEPYEPLRVVQAPSPLEAVAAAIQPAGGGQSVVPGESAAGGNQRLVERSAQMHARRLIRATRPRYAGRVRYEGLHELVPFGSARSLRYRVESTGRVLTEVELG